MIWWLTMCVPGPEMWVLVLPRTAPGMAVFLTVERVIVEAVPSMMFCVDWVL